MLYRDSSFAEDVFETYWFEKNLQGDIVAVYDAAGTKLISYAYDAWGNFATTYHNDCTSSNPANFNPYRYRGYYYDAELEMYYLQSRYYDPVIGRFINPDKYIFAGQGFVGYNMFAYCLNNHVNKVDYTGAISIGMLIGAALFIGSVILGATTDVDIAETISPSENSPRKCFSLEPAHQPRDNTPSALKP